MEVSDLYENQMLDPPFPETRFFEIEIDEDQKNRNEKCFAFQNICPVHAKTETRLAYPEVPDPARQLDHHGTDPGPDSIWARSQWIYTDDFDILFVSSGDGTILRCSSPSSRGSSMPLPSRSAPVPVSPRSLRTSLPAARHSVRIFSDGIDGAFREAVIYRDHAQAFPDR